MMASKVNNLILNADLKGSGRRKEIIIDSNDAVGSNEDKVRWGKGEGIVEAV